MEIAELKCAMLTYIIRNGRRVHDTESMFMNHTAIPAIPLIKFSEYFGDPLNRSKVVKLKHGERLIDEIRWKLKQL